MHLRKIMQIPPSLPPNTHTHTLDTMLTHWLAPVEPSNAHMVISGLRPQKRTNLNLDSAWDFSCNG